MTSTTAPSASVVGPTCARLFTTTKCPDGTFYGALMNADHIVVAMSKPMRSRAAARSWAVRALAAATAAAAALAPGATSAASWDPGLLQPEAATVNALMMGLWIFALAGLACLAAFLASLAAEGALPVIALPEWPRARQRAPQRKRRASPRKAARRPS